MEIMCARLEHNLWTPIWGALSWWIPSRSRSASAAPRGYLSPWRGPNGGSLDLLWSGHSWRRTVQNPRTPTRSRLRCLPEFWGERLRIQRRNDCMNEWKNEWMNGWMNEWMDEWMNEWMNEWKNEWMNEWMNGWMNEGWIMDVNNKFNEY